MSTSLLSDAGYIKEDDQMDTEDPRKSEDKLLDTHNNGDTNPGQNLPQKQEYGETSPQKEETSGIPEREQSRKQRHSNISTSAGLFYRSHSIGQSTGRRATDK